MHLPEGRCRAPVRRIRTPLLGLSKDRPSVDMSFSRPLPDCAPTLRSLTASVDPRKRRSRAILRPEAAMPPTRSTLAISRGFGGLLRLEPCRFVAPCSRPWGSPGFRTVSLPVPARCAPLLRRNDSVCGLQHHRPIPSDRASPPVHHASVAALSGPSASGGRCREQ